MTDSSLLSLSVCVHSHWDWYRLYSFVSFIIKVCHLLCIIILGMSEQAIGLIDIRIHRNKLTTICCRANCVLLVSLFYSLPNSITADSEEQWGCWLIRVGTMFGVFPDLTPNSLKKHRFAHCQLWIGLKCQWMQSKSSDPPYYQGSFQSMSTIFRRKRALLMRILMILANFSWFSLGKLDYYMVQNIKISVKRFLTPGEFFSSISFSFSNQRDKTWHSFFCISIYL